MFLKKIPTFLFNLTEKKSNIFMYILHLNDKMTIKKPTQYIYFLSQIN